MPLDQDQKREVFEPYIAVMREARKAAGLSQAGVALQAGYSRKYVTLIEKGDKLPSIEAMIVLCSISGVGRSIVENFIEEILGLQSWSEEERS